MRLCRPDYQTELRHKRKGETEKQEINKRESERDSPGEREETEDEECTRGYDTDDSAGEQEENGAGKKSLRSGTKIGGNEISRFLKEARTRAEEEAEKPNPPKENARGERSRATERGGGRKKGN